VRQVGYSALLGTRERGGGCVLEGQVVLIRGLYKSPIGMSSDVSVAGGGLRVLRSPELFFKSQTC